MTTTSPVPSPDALEPADREASESRRGTYQLSDRITETTGTVAMTGIQAVIRVPLDQKRIDERNGLRTAGLICGYRGSPVGTMDQAYNQDRKVLEANDIRFISGVNEDLGATAIWGSQQTALEESALFDGVMGLWYGKGPGVDRTGDVFRHANTSGVHSNGGVIAVAGDDPACKSSTIASASEWSLADLAMPVLYPSNVQDVLDFGRLAYAMSRFSGAWVSLKLHTNVADAYSTVDLDLDRFTLQPASYLVDGEQWHHRQSNTLIAPMSLHLEEEMFGHRLDAAKAFSAAQNSQSEGFTFDRIIRPDDEALAGQAKVGIVCAGPVYGELRDALKVLGFASDADLAHAGIRLYKPAMIWPLEPSRLFEFTDGLDEIIVIEEKRAFIETQIRDLLYQRLSSPNPDGSAKRLPQITGKSDPDGRSMFASHGALLTGDLQGPLRQRLNQFVESDRMTRERIPVVAASSAPVASPGAAIQSRSAYFCSGCPHNRSTNLPDGSRGHGGIGCHTMSLGMDRNVFGVTHMGGEGAQWVGMAPFVADNHRFQNLGDGTLAHSGSLAIRQAISAGTNITYKILYNGTVAMTGGQDAAGEISVPDLTHWLRAEGVAKTIVVADNTKKYPSGSSFAKNSSLVHRDKLDAVQVELRDIPGVTVLIYDQACAAELRRGRKRGTIETPTTRIMIDESICEGCGDCGEVSNCASVHPVQTPFGRKTQIHQESCNYDLTCLKGNCPAFVSIEVDPEDADHKPSSTVTSSNKSASARAQIPEGDLPPDPTIPQEGNVLLVGIGGTGVVTVNQVIATAALLDNKYSTGLDQTGLAQKGGSVVSNLRITREPAESSNRVGAGEADTILIFDLLTMMKNLDRASSERTRAIVSTGLVPTGNMAAGRAADKFPELAQFRSGIDEVTRSEDNLWLDATGIARRVFASQPAANTMVVGLAYQRGMLPVTGASIERAIELNGVAVQMNLDAFRLGRRLAANETLLASLDSGDPGTDGKLAGPPVLTGRLAAQAERIGGSSQLQETLAWRLPELVGYQDQGYADRYAHFVGNVREAEQQFAGDSCELSETVARHLFKLMTYKDEYEVARLALKSDLSEQAKALFGPNAKLNYRLEPPTMKAVGIDRKIAIPEVAGRKMFEGLVKSKKARGRRFDPFGRSAERVAERALIVDYENLITTLIEELSTGTTDNQRYQDAIAIADLADQVRGFAEVKMGNIENYQTEVKTALESFLN